MILKTAQDPNNYARDLIYASAAREAWTHLIRELKVPAGRKVLLPSYIGYTEREGSGVFDPIDATGVAYAFYPITGSLGVDMESFEKLLKEGDIHVALVIHYFGFCRNDINEINNVCKLYNVLLVEDCAHAFQLGLKKQVLGVNGDFSFYSLHKYLATTSGGILQINNPAYSLTEVPEPVQMDRRVLEQLIKTDVNGVAERRRENYLLYFELLKDIDGIEIMYELLPDDIPHNFPIKVKHGKREPLYFYMTDRNMTMIALYYRLIDHIKKEDFPLSFEIANQILNLPVHQDTSEEDVRAISNCIREYFNK